ncbi:tagatose-6-phosphate kinase [Virgibacillus pantothenticus]|uniref:1-phosphofructokinase n=1 Tax=Virgibacillus TaxID=84406 RepID=UPI00090A4B5F|nr:MULTISPECIES: 1-phosphofructokinase [Virgibacillus]API91985.1 1-phosphofructokinase [Virgibacillus sp. 6R]MBS7430443.1 1-phosphofructokinase [Virgibacillus sp. 19R1-5]MBU8566381.1 1-phosphofructokinase [Virgibacillus pantothenticus]MBU8600203.1 1-phosphofructokinase [Virgibacillus pantothenticus]MBU8633865.1 1-phosphofructokinase [Virgibacillus pantothenticus]
MIYTCTMNTAIDLYVAMEALQPNTVNRTYDEDYQPNGKGVNVSVMLKKMGIPNTALGFIGGFTGQFIKEELEKLGIATDFIEVEGNTRINVFINANEEYKIVNRGPVIHQQAVNQLLAKIKKIPTKSTLIVSGSLPRGVEDQILVSIAKICNENDLKLILDSSSPAVLETLAYRPYLLKPNEEELAQLFGEEVSLSEEQMIAYGKELIQRGARHVIISRGEAGALYIDKQKIMKASSPKGKVVNTACAGDALLASYIAQTLSSASIDEALVYAVATGASTAFSKGLSDLRDIPDLIKDVDIQHLRR